MAGKYWVAVGAWMLVVAGTGAWGGEGGVFNVRAFGAKGDGVMLDSPAIDAAIAACAKGGGGTVMVPAGTYLCGSVHLQSNVHLLIDAGAVILGAPQAMKAYDRAETFEGTAYQDGGHTYFHNSLMWGEGLTNVSITGKGMINGGGLTRKDKETGLGPVEEGDKAIALKNCRDVLFRDITIFHGGHFAILATGCDNVTVDNVTMDTNRDGIDIDCCRNVMVSNCRVNSPRDDGICLKSSLGLGKARITENVVIVNCTVSGFEEGTLLDGTMRPHFKKGDKPAKYGYGRIKLGTESNGGFRNIAISNCTFRNCSGLALEEVDGGIMENITISNLAMMDLVDYPIYIRLGARNRGPAGTETGTARNILISNVVVTNCEPLYGIEILGVPGHAIEGVRLENIRVKYNGGGTKKDAEKVQPEMEASYPEPSMAGVSPAYGFFVRHVKELELVNIRLGFAEEDMRPAMVCEDVEGLEVFNFKAKLAGGVMGGIFREVKGLVVRESPGIEGGRVNPKSETRNSNQ